MESQKKFQLIYNDVLSEMEKNGIRFINEKQLTKPQRDFCVNYFSDAISPLLVPIILRKTTKMPYLNDRCIYHAIKMTSKGKMGARYAIIEIPVNKNCPSFVELPSEEGHNDIIFVDDIIRLCLDDIFFMFPYDKISAYTFKFTRDGLLTLDDDISKSLVEKMGEGIESRLHGHPVRLVYDEKMPEDLLKLIVSKLGLKDRDNIEGGGRYHGKRDFMKFPNIRPELENEKQKALLHPDIKPFSSIIDVIRKKDILLNYPYHSFRHFVDFLREAAIDPKVETICISLYRTAESSQVVNSLINAKKNGKKVIVLVELFARFDEEQNVINTEILQKAGVKVIHAPEGLKVHSKLVLVERREKSEQVGYVYVGTGNFNESTAKIYGDFGLLTANQEIAADARNVFRFLENPHKRFSCKHLLVSPYFMRNQFEEMIEQEIKNAKKNKKAYIYAKFNSLTDEKIINLLYKASRAGVKIRLIIRGAFCLQPQVNGQSENKKPSVLSISIWNMRDY